jgi:sugar phosphate isomerase/epimerase
MPDIFCGSAIGGRYGISAELLALAASRRIERVEVSMYGAALDVHDRAALGAMAAAMPAGLECRSVHLVFGDVNDISLTNDDARRKALDEACYEVSAAPILGARLAVVHGSDEPIDDKDRPGRMACLRESLPVLCRVAQESGVRLALELLPRTCLGHTTEEAFAIVEGLPAERIGFCLDVNHINLRQDPASAVRLLGSRILTFHISDNDGLDERHWFPFEGIIDWKSFMGAVRDIGYGGQFIFETGGSLGGDMAAYLGELRARFDRLMAL